MNEFKDILLEGEEVLWSGAPDWERAERPKTGWRGKLGIIKFAAAMAFAFVALMAFGMLVDPDGFAGGTLGVLIVLSAISFCVAFFNLIDTDDEPIVQPDHRYAITDRRVIIHDYSKQTTQSIIGCVLFDVSTTLNGAVRNLYFSYLPHDYQTTTMFALDDVDVPEKLLIERFAHRKAETP